MDWAKAAGYRSGDNPVDGVSKGLPKQTDEPKHHDAMPFKDVPAFVARLRNVEGQPPLGHLGLEFLIHTALRTKEVLNTEWSEVNFIDRVLEKTGPHMKGKKPHSVPLSDRVIEILRHLQRLGLHDRLVFPGLKPDEPLSNMVFLETLKRMNVSIGVEC
jgi:integrase